MTTVWITKTIFTDGIYKAEFKSYYRLEDEVAKIDVKRDGSILGCEYLFYKGEWHKTEAEAKKKANEMRLKKIKSLEKQLEKLHKLEF